MPRSLEILDGNTWQEFVAAPFAVLVLGKSDCAACQQWSDELTQFLGDDAQSGSWNQVRFGKIVLDTPGLASFKRANTWLADVDVLPFNVIYANGAQVRTFAGGGVDRLTTRLQNVTTGNI